MVVKLSTSLGQIDVSSDVVATLAGAAAMDCYGLVGMASRKGLKDGIIELLGRENMGRGVEVRNHDGKTVIDLYIIVSYGTKISEVAHNVQEKVKYQLQTYLGVEIDEVNVYVQGVQNI